MQIEIFESHRLSTSQHREIVIATSGNFVDAPEERTLGVATLGGSLFGQPDGGGELWFREVSLAHGDRVRLRAVVVPSPRVVPTEYRSAAAAGFETRDELGAVLLDRLA